MMQRSCWSDLGLGEGDVHTSPSDIPVVQGSRRIETFLQLRKSNQRHELVLDVEQ